MSVATCSTDVETDKQYLLQLLDNYLKRDDGELSKHFSDKTLFHKYLYLWPLVVRYIERREQQDQNPLAQNLLSFMYSVGCGCTRDLDKALAFAQKSSDQNCDTGQNSLGNLCMANGDHVKAHLLWIKSAAQGNFSAKYSLAKLMIKMKKPEEAWLLYQELALDGHPLAQNSIGFAYDTGKIQGLNIPFIEKDITIAFQWYQKSAEQNDCSGQVNLSLCYSTVAKLKNLKHAKEWAFKAAHSGYASGQYLYADLIFNEDINNNYILAIDWAIKSAQQNNSGGQYLLGSLYVKRFGQERNPFYIGKAFKWLLLASRSNTAYADLATSFLAPIRNDIPNHSETLGETILALVTETDTMRNVTKNMMMAKKQYSEDLILFIEQLQLEHENLYLEVSAQHMNCVLSHCIPSELLKLIQTYFHVSF